MTEMKPMHVFTNQSPSKAQDCAEYYVRIGVRRGPAGNWNLEPNFLENVKSAV